MFLRNVLSQFFIVKCFSKSLLLNIFNEYNIPAKLEMFENPCVLNKSYRLGATRNRNEAEKLSLI